MATNTKQPTGRKKISRRKRRNRQIKIIMSSVLAAVIVFAAAVLFSQLNRPQEVNDISSVPTGVLVTAMPVPELTAEPTAMPTEAPTPAPTETPLPTDTPEPTETPAPTAAPKPVTLQYPYFIEVDKSKQVVTIYTLGEEGYYDLMVKQFICSTGHCDKIEDGMYRIGQKYRWKMMENESYVQYASRISGPYLFHSGCYYSANPNKLKWRYYDRLGTNASSGCIRLTVGDALWIYTNCPEGTPIHVFTGGVRDEELLEQLKPPVRTGNWDPTDPDPKNPYYVTPSPDTTPDPTPALGVTPAPTPAWTVHPTLKSWGYC